MTDHCKKCGVSLTESPLLQGQCVRCLWAASLDPDPNPRPVDAPTPDEVAAHFPDLEVLECLGRGGMGTVYKVRQRRLQRLAALKLMAAPASTRAGFSERFLREARTLAQLDHAGIVRIYDVGESDGQSWILMEFVDGANLRTLLREGAITTTLALQVLQQLCEALQSAHEVGIVHRDIKPENVLLDRFGQAKLVDFGLAKLRAGVDDLLTRSQQGLGTAHYAAPEQTVGAASVDARADVYSLGVLAYELLTGELPFGRFEPPSHKAGLDAAVDDVILRALERDPDRRPRDAGELRREIARVSAALRAVADQLGPRPQTVAAATPGPEAASASAPQGGIRPVRLRFAGVAWWGMVASSLCLLTSTLLTWHSRGNLWTQDLYEVVFVPPLAVPTSLMVVALALVFGAGRGSLYRPLRLVLNVIGATFVLGWAGSSSPALDSDVVFDIWQVPDLCDANSFAILLMLGASVALQTFARRDRRSWLRQTPQQPLRLAPRVLLVLIPAVLIATGVWTEVRGLD